METVPPQLCILFRARASGSVSKHKEAAAAAEMRQMALLNKANFRQQPGLAVGRVP